MFPSNTMQLAVHFSEPWFNCYEQNFSTDWRNPEVYCTI